MTKPLLMTTTVFAQIALGTLPALAHVGHIGEVAGHNHWGAIILLGGAAAVGIWASIKGKKDAAKAEEEGSSEAEEETGDEAPVGA